jgi:hypothetical protein
VDSAIRQREKEVESLDIGTVVSIHIASAAMAPMQSLPEVRAVPGKGFEGDRYFTSSGTFGKPPGPDYEATFIESEAIEALPAATSSLGGWP